MNKSLIVLAALLLVALGYGIGLVLGIDLGKATCTRELDKVSNLSNVSIVKVPLYYNIDDPTKIYVYENETFVETYINNSSEIK